MSELERCRKEAKRLVRAHRAGDADAHSRAAAVLGDRAASRFALTDAQYMLARERGHRSWADLRRSLESPLGTLMQQEVGDVLVSSGVAYGDGEPIEIHVRKRLHRYDLSDRGRAVEKAGTSPGWLDVAERAVEPMNVARNGQVFVGALPHDLAVLERMVGRVADASRAVHEALLVLDE